MWQPGETLKIIACQDESSPISAKGQESQITPETLFGDRCSGAYNRVSQGGKKFPVRLTLPRSLLSADENDLDSFDAIVDESDLT